VAARPCQGQGDADGDRVERLGEQPAGGEILGRIVGLGLGGVEDLDRVPPELAEDEQGQREESGQRLDERAGRDHLRDQVEADNEQRPDRRREAGRALPQPEREHHRDERAEGTTPVMKPSKPPRNMSPVTPRKAAADM